MKRFFPKRFFAAVFAALFGFSCFACAENYEYEYFEKDAWIFSGTMAFYVRLLGQNAPEAYDEMTETLESLGNEISLTNKDSVLTYFNSKAKAGEKVEVSADTYKIISLSLEYERETQGAFSIGAYSLGKLWGVDANGYINGFDPFESESISCSLPALSDIGKTKAHCNTSCLTLSENGGKYYIEKSDKEFMLDLGGIAKGYCADLCTEIMRKHSLKSGLVNVSGNIALYGRYYDGKKFTDWEIAVINPRPKASVLRDEICLLQSGGDVSVVTSGDYRRYYRHESGLELCHIIDPIIGLPTDITLLDGEYVRKSEVVSSATVMCSSSARADAYSTALAVMGIEDGFEFMKSRDGADALIFTEVYDGNAGEEVRGRVAATDNVKFINTDTFGGFRRYESYSGR